MCLHDIEVLVQVVRVRVFIMVVVKEEDCVDFLVMGLRADLGDYSRRL